MENKIVTVENFNGLKKFFEIGVKSFELRNLSSPPTVLTTKTENLFKLGFDECNLESPNFAIIDKAFIDLENLKKAATVSANFPQGGCINDELVD
jgi:hypothetical protein